MKKVLLVIGFILVSLTIMAPNPEKAEKLKVNGHDWDRDPAQFVVSLTCQFGTATAGEHADFKIGANITIAADGKTYQLVGERNIVKAAGAEKDADNFIAIEPLTIDWPEGKNFEGVASVTSSVSLVGPSGNVQGDPVIYTDSVLINDPLSPDVMIDDEDWDYDPEKNSIVVPLLADSKLVDFLQAEGYTVTVDVKVLNIDGSIAGSGSGSGNIVKVEDQDYDYVPIKPVFALLGEGVKWNGDDDGSGIVSGTILVLDPDGKVISTTTFDYITVGFVIHEPLPEA
jgi:hypothetical protein